MSRPLRIAQVVHGWPGEEAGGTGLYVEALSAALAEAGHAVTVVTPGPVAEADPAGVAVAALPSGVRWRWRHGWAQPARARAWRALVGRWRPDVVHVHHLSGLPLDLPAAARAAGARVVMTLHDYFLPCARGQLVDRDLRPCPGPSGVRCARCLGPDRTPPRAAWIDRVQARAVAARAAVAQAHVLLSPSRDLADRFAALGWRRPEPTALPLVRPVAPAPPPGAGPVRFLFASTVVPTKGPDRLVAAFARLPRGSATLTVAGPSPRFAADPDFGDRLVRAIGRTPGATWRGGVPPAEIPALLNAHDVLVLPSTWPENSPLIVREATAAGLRVVASAAGGSRELDPSLRALPPGAPIGAITAALAAEIAVGRGRRAPLSWPTPAAHAARLVREAYTAG